MYYEEEDGTVRWSPPWWSFLVGWFMWMILLGWGLRWV